MCSRCVNHPVMDNGYATPAGRQALQAVPTAPGRGAGGGTSAFEDVLTKEIIPMMRSH